MKLLKEYITLSIIYMLANNKPIVKIVFSTRWEEDVNILFFMDCGWEWG